MDNWRRLTEDEKELLLKYYELDSKLPKIFFSAPKVIGTLYAASGIYEAIVNLKTATTAMTTYTVISSMIAFCFFWWISNRLLRLSRQEINSLQNNSAQICTATILSKQKVHSHKHNCHWRYEIKAEIWINSKLEECCITTSNTAFSQLNIGDMCCVVYFGADNQKPMSEHYMIAYDTDFKDVERTIRIYGG